jgi:hypothetical protein
MDTDESGLMINWLNELTKRQKTIHCSFGNPFDLTSLDKAPVLMLSFTDATPAPMLAAQMIFGTRQGFGIAPITINNLFNKGDGRPNRMIDRLGYGIPEQAEMDGDVLNKIDAIVKQALDSGATPGCNVIVARKGIVVYNKTFGWKTYDKA